MSRSFAMTVSALLSMCFLLSPLQADIVSGETEREVAREGGAEQEIAGQLTASGSAPEAAASVVGGMTSAEVEYFSSKGDRAQPAGHHGGVLVLVLIVGIVLLALYLSKD